MTDGPELVARPSGGDTDSQPVERVSREHAGPGPVATSVTLMRAARAAGLSAVPAEPETGRIRRSSAVGLAGGVTDEHTESRIRAARNGGAELAEPVRRQMEGAFGTDLGDVRVHAGAESTELNNRIQAKAFAVGNDVFFRDGLPDTSRPEGQHLLAHELAHTLQERGRIARRTSEVIHRTVESDWLDDPDGFDDAASVDHRRTLKSRRYTAIITALTAIANTRGVLDQRLPALMDLVAAIAAWQAKAGDDNPRRPIVERLRVEAADHAAFLSGLIDAAGVFDFNRSDRGRLEAALANHTDVVGHRLAAFPMYQELVGRATARRGRAETDLAGVVASRAGLTDVVARMQAILGEDRSPRAIGDAFNLVLRANGLRYAPSANAVDVFGTPQGPADCSSVAGGLVRAALELGVDASRIDCGDSYFLTTEMPAHALASDGSNVINSTGDASYGGDRFYFPSHYVARIGNISYCAVVGAPWDPTTHVALSNGGVTGGFRADVTGTPLEGANVVLQRVFDDGAHAIGRVDDAGDTHLVRAVPAPVPAI